MIFRKHALALLLTGSLLAAPSAALAQSAGDEQYRDPFAGGGGGGQQQQQQPSSGGNAGQQQAAPAPAPQPQAAQQPQEVPESSVAQQVPSEQLPRTGAPALLLAGAGFLLATGGALLRRLA